MRTPEEQVAYDRGLQVALDGGELSEFITDSQVPSESLRRRIHEQEGFIAGLKAGDKS